MSTLTLDHRTGIGHPSIIRGYAVTFGEFKSSLLQRLWELYRGAVTFAPYRDSVSQLIAGINDVMTEGIDEHSANDLMATLTPAIEFLMARPLDVAPPEVDVWESGKIGFEWYVAPNRIVDATIDRNRRLVFSALIGQTSRGAVDFVDGEWPSELIAAIRDVRS